MSSQTIIPRKRCTWCDENSTLYVHYHDIEWGVPLTDDTRLFEMLVLESMQAGLSWITVLKKRQEFRCAFDGFDCAAVAAYDGDKVETLLGNTGIIRNRSKIEAAVQNAAVVLALKKEYGSLAHYLWQYVDYSPIQNGFACQQDVPASTVLSQTIAKDLKKRGMRFVGPTIIYALMQAIGMVNDHTTDCFRHDECAWLAGNMRRGAL